MDERRDCSVCGMTFLTVRPDIQTCSLKCDWASGSSRTCPVCKKDYRPKRYYQVQCGDAACEKTYKRNQHNAAHKKRITSIGVSVKKEEHAPFKPCVSCANWKKEPPGMTDMGGQCVPGLFRACKPWDGAVHHKEKAR